MQKKSDTLGTQHEDVRPSKELRGIALYTSILHKLIKHVKDNSLSIAVDENGEPIFSDSPNTPEENKKDVVVSTEPVPGTPAYGPPSIPTSFGNPNIPRGGGNVNEKPYSAQAQSRSDNQGGFSDGKKQAQFEIIQRENPMQDDIHTGIRSADEIKDASKYDTPFLAYRLTIRRNIFIICTHKQVLKVKLSLSTLHLFAVITEKSNITIISCRLRKIKKT